CRRRDREQRSLATSAGAVCASASAAARASASPADGTEDLSTTEEPSLAPEDEIDEGSGDIFFFDTSDPPPLPPCVQDTVVSTPTACVSADGTPGYQHVVGLTHSLVELCVKGYITNAEEEHIVERWENLLEVDKPAVVYPPPYRQELAPCATLMKR
ncbi:S-phase kinase-associated 2-like isoform X2, partial [Clarias magur]